MIERMVVDLPTPLRPSRQTHSPAPTSIETPNSTHDSPYAVWISRTSRSGAVTNRRGGPRHGPPASSSEGGYAPLGLPRPSLGRAPAQPWRASGLTQNVSLLGLDQALHEPALHGHDHGHRRRQHHHGHRHRDVPRGQLGGARDERLDPDHGRAHL